jgi:hypothetical protein
LGEGWQPLPVKRQVSWRWKEEGMARRWAVGQ